MYFVNIQSITIFHCYQVSVQPVNCSLRHQRVIRTFQFRLLFFIVFKQNFTINVWLLFEFKLLRLIAICVEIDLAIVIVKNNFVYKHINKSLASKLVCQVNILKRTQEWVNNIFIKWFNNKHSRTYSLFLLKLSLIIR